LQWIEHRESSSFSFYFFICIFDICNLIFDFPNGVRVILLKIGLDLDDVITDLIGELLRIHNKKYKPKAERKDIQDWSFFTPEVQEEFWQGDGLKVLPLLPKAKDLVSWLRSRGELSIITMRSPEHREATLEWLVNNMPGLYESEKIYFTGGSKLSVCQQLGLQLLIDDSINHTRQVAEELGIYAIMYNNGTSIYQNASPHPLIYKAENIEQAKERVLDITAKLGHTCQSTSSVCLPR